jgi:ADP-heptose:LPS heptosyltransferase
MVPALLRLYVTQVRHILVVRRDNIGDLVCTTPLFAALRARFPDAWLGALVNSYNAPVLAGNDDLSKVFAYTKLKHLDAGQSAWRLLGARFSDLWRLRRMKLDSVVLATTTPSARNQSLAGWLAPAAIVGYDAALDRAMQGRHEVERVFALAARFGVEGPIPPLKVVADAAEAERAVAAFPAGPGPRIAVHVSARRRAQRWPAERFAALIARLRTVHDARCMLLWAPGAADHPQHPGDNEKSARIRALLGTEANTVFYPTTTLPALIGALAACDYAILPDGGAMHLAAALGKPVVALFGDSPVDRWRPWGVPHRVLCPASRDVNDIALEAVEAAYASLAAELLAGHATAPPVR